MKYTKILFLGLCWFTSFVGLNTEAKSTSVFDPDCNNYCAFSEFKNRCQGVRFKFTNSKNETEHVYTIWNSALNACVSVKKFPKFFSIKPKKINEQCHCDAPSDPPAQTLPNPTQPITANSKAALEELQVQIKKWAPCAPDPETITPFSLLRPLQKHQIESCEAMKEKGLKGYIVVGGCQDDLPDNCTYYPNTNILAGPLCLAGDLDRCDNIRTSQDPVTGAWYRNAYQRLYPNSEQGQPLFSRDEVVGMLMYFAKTKDKTAATKWLQFLQNNPRKESFLLGRLLGSRRAHLIKVIDICPKRPAVKPPDISDDRWAEMANDDRCEMRPTTWGLMYRVYQSMGFTDHELKNISLEAYRKMRAYRSLATLGNEILAQTTSAVGGASYQIALLANNIWMMQSIGKTANRHTRALNTIHRRTGYISPYFHYLAHHQKSTEYGAYLIQKFCPANQPFFGRLPNRGVALPTASFFDTGMRSFGGLNEYGIQSEPTGHDCLAWIQLHLK